MNVAHDVDNADDYDYAHAQVCELGVDERVREYVSPIVGLLIFMS